MTEYNRHKRNMAILEIGAMIFTGIIILTGSIVLLAAYAEALKAI